MMNSLKLWQLLCLLLLYLASCKEELNMPAPLRGLDVQVVNSQNKAVTNAEVEIYTSNPSLIDVSEAYARGVTDGSGIAQFKVNADSIWIRATWIDLVTKEVYQNTLVNFKPIEPLPENGQATFRVKINSAKILKGIIIKKAVYNRYTYNNCDSNGSYYQNQITYCNTYLNLQDISGQACDPYLLIENSTSEYSHVVNSYFFRSNVETDAAASEITFEINKTITDFRKPYYIGIREHVIVNPQDYTNRTCSNGTYSNLGDYLASEQGQEHVFDGADRYISNKVPLFNASGSVMPSYPADEITISLSDYSDEALKVYLGWIYE